MAAAVQQHPAEGEVVVDGRHQPAGGGGKRGRAAPLTALGRVVDLHLARLGAAPVAGRETSDLAGGHAEAGILHPQRLEEALAQERLERLSRGALDQHAQHVGAGVVHPSLARLMHQGQRAEAADPRVGCGLGLRPGRAHPDPLLAHRLLDRERVGRRHDDAEAQPEGQQIAQGDRPARGHRVVDRPLEPAQDPAVGQLGQQPVHRLVEPQPALLHKDQGRDGRDRLGHGGDAEDRVALHRPPTVGRGAAERLDVHLVAAAHQRDDPRHGAALHVTGHHVAHAPEPYLRESSAPGCHRLLLTP